MAEDGWLPTPLGVAGRDGKVKRLPSFYRRALKPRICLFVR